MKIEFDNASVLTIVPDDSVEAMALRYWEKEYETHGPKMLAVETQIPIRLTDKSQE